MKQMSDVETTTSSRPAFMGFAGASLMACLISSAHRVETPPVVPQAPTGFKGSPDPSFQRRLCGWDFEPRRCRRAVGEESGEARAEMHRVVPSAILFYRQHPISEDQVLDALRRQGKDLGKLFPQDLYHWDQDHYGGLAAVEALTRRAGISADSHVLDVCAGLAGPARFIAARCAARVTCVDLSPERAAGAKRLTALVGLDRLAREGPP